MSEEDNKANGTGAGAGADGKDAGQTTSLQMTQEQLDKLISERIERARKTWTAEKDKADEEARKKAEIEKLEGVQKAEAQYKLELEKLSSERDAFQRQLRVANAKAELSARGLDANFAETLIGKDDETTKANIDNFQKMVDAQVADKVKAGLVKGAPPAGPEANGAEDPIKSAIERGFGINAKR